MKKALVLLVAFLMVGMSAMAVSAAEWNFYGSARVQTFYVDKEAGDYKALGTKDSKYLDFKLMDGARLGARVDVSDTLYGRFEYGHIDGKAILRLLYGRWDFGGGKLYVGRMYSPLAMTEGNSVYNGSTNAGYGAVYGGRVEGIKLSFHHEAYEIGIYDPAAYAKMGDTQEFTWPRIEARFFYPMGNFMPFGGAAYQTYKATKTSGAPDASYGTTKESKIDSYILTGGVRYTVGAFYMSASIWGGQNVNEMYIWSEEDGGYTQSIARPTYDYYGYGNDVHDTDSIGYFLYGGYILNDTWKFEAGVSGINSDSDSSRMTQTDKSLNYYIQAIWTLAPGVTITPEIGVHDGKDGYAYTDSAYMEEIKFTYFGMKWQISF